MNKSKLTNNIFLFIIFSLFFSNIVAIGYSNEVGITDGMYIKHFLTQHSHLDGWPTTLTFSKTSDDLFHVTWRWESPSDMGSGHWDVTISTNIVSNMDNFGPPDDSHNGCWIYINASLNDQIIMYNHPKESYTGDGDTVYNITGEYSITGGTMDVSMEVWELEDAFGSVLWYEKSKGFLVNGTNRYNAYWEKYEFIETNAFSSPEGGIPGYNYFFLFGLLLVSAIVILKNKSIRE